MKPIDDILRKLADQAEEKDKTVEAMISDFQMVAVFILLRDFFEEMATTKRATARSLADSLILEWRARQENQFAAQLDRFEMMAMSVLGPTVGRQAAPRSELMKHFLGSMTRAEAAILKGLQLDGE